MSSAKNFSTYARQGHFDEKRLLILEEAARQFVENGVHETSLNDIARQFKISKPALYHYVEGKDDIIAQILEHASRDHREMLLKTESLDEPALERLRVVLKRYARSMANDFGRCMATIQVSTFSRKTQNLHRRTHRALFEGLSDIVEEGIADGSIRDCDPQIIALSIFGALNSMARWFDLDGRMSIDEVADEIVSAFLDGIRP